MADIFDLFKKIESGSSAANSSVSWLIVGLGNPGAEYVRTRHNVGFAAVDALAQAVGVRIDRAKYHALVGEATVAGARVLLMKPQTYMNASGKAVAEAARFYKIDPTHILVYSDDISLAPGRLRVRADGSAGGHNGLKSIIECLGAQNFPRIKIGVGQKPTPEYDLADWVLGKLPIADGEAVDARHKDLIAGTEALIRGEYDLAMRLCNGGR
ncbi:MAG: aminoacyl-tRNA hydrolase [Clostridia bacterium]|nr:aminoacyl-tRNA hydrolase [Clostridia bacterium]